MLSAFIINWIALVLSAQREVGSSEENPSSVSRPWSHVIFEHGWDIAWYSTLVEDFETRSCFLDFQEIRLCPKINII
jgi:hypothetical protein